MNDFRALAACREFEPELFFPVGTPGAPLYDAQLEQAQAVCARCPVRAECLLFALDEGIGHGVFGGVDEHERAALRRTLPARRVAV